MSTCPFHAPICNVPGIFACGAHTQAMSCADYVRLLKYGDSLYRCKELKRAALVSHLLPSSTRAPQAEHALPANKSSQLDCVPPVARSQA